jgi:hypothetical protein
MLLVHAMFTSSTERIESALASFGMPNRVAIRSILVPMIDA